MRCDGHPVEETSRASVFSRPCRTLLSRAYPQNILAVEAALVNILVHFKFSEVTFPVSTTELHLMPVPYGFPAGHKPAFAS